MPNITLKEVLDTVEKLRMPAEIGSKLGYVMCLRQRTFDALKELATDEGQSPNRYFPTIEFFVSELIPEFDKDGKPIVGFWIKRELLTPLGNPFNVKFERIN